jgi:hypothetical protein
VPNIATYDANAELTPTDRGIQAAEVAGRRIGLYGHELAEQAEGIGHAIEQHMSVMETSELYKTGTELRLNLQQKYDQESALPENRNDPHFGDRFMAEVGPMIDEWGKHAGTERGKMLAAEMSGQIRNEIFNHVAAGQSEMDTAHVLDNGKQTASLLGAGLITDPSEGNLDRSLGTLNDAVDGMTMSIPDVGTRERVATELKDQYRPQLVLSRYQGVAESIKNQIAQTGGETSPALEQLNKDMAGQLGYQYLTPEQQARLPEIRDEAVRQGQELYKSKNETAKSQAVEAGKAAYSDIHNRLTVLAMTGQPPTPDDVAAIQKYTQLYGKTNPGEVASLDDFLLKGQDRAMENKVQPFNQNVRDSIQAGFAFPIGDPRRPTLPSLAKAYSAGQITPEDFNRYSEILNKLDKPTEDPTFKPAWENLKRWQEQMVQSIGNKGFPGTSAARAQFLHDSTAAFMAQGHGGVGWDKALDTLTSAQNPHSFVHVISFYNKAANRSDAAQWLQQHDQFYANPHGTPALGSSAAPVYPTAQTPSQPAKMDQKDVDSVIWGPH